MTPGPSPDRAELAARRGWVSPLAWDDDTIDDPDALPALDVVRDALDDELDLLDVEDQADELDHARLWLAQGGDLPWRELTSSEKTAVVAELARRYHDATIAARLRCSHKAVMKWRERHDIPAYVPSGRGELVEVA